MSAAFTSWPAKLQVGAALGMLSTTHAMQVNNYLATVTVQTGKVGSH